MVINSVVGVTGGMSLPIIIRLDMTIGGESVGVVNSGK